MANPPWSDAEIDDLVDCVARHGQLSHPLGNIRQNCTTVAWAAFQNMGHTRGENAFSTQWSKLHRRLRPQLATTVFPAHITSPGQKLRMLYNLSRTQPAGGILAAPAGGSASLGAPGAAPAALLLAAAPASIPAGLAAVHPAAPVPAVTTAAAAPSVAPVAAVARRAAPDRTPADGAEMHTAAQQYSNISQNQRDTLLNHHLSHLAAIVVSQTEATAEDLWDAVRDRLAELIEELNM